MTAPDDPESPQRKWRPSFRYFHAAAAFVGGVILTVRYAGGIGAGGTSAVAGIGGLALIVLSIALLPIIRWMEKRGL